MQTFNYTKHRIEESILSFLLKRFPYQGQAQWIDAINAGAIQINGESVTEERILENCDLISYERPRSSEPEIDPKYNVLYQDNHLIVVEKSGNIPVAESGKYYRNTLINVLKENEDIEALFTVHRLDKETSGVVVISKKKEVATQLGIQFQRRQTDKKYIAVLSGEMEMDKVLVERAIKKRPIQLGSVRIRQIISPTGKSARSEFHCIRKSGGLTLARIQLFTGRTHQIRCHAEYLGYPVLGDKLYGQSDEHFIQMIKGEIKPVFKPYGVIDRQLLHAEELSFYHPVLQKEMLFQSDFRNSFGDLPFLKKLIR